MSRTLFLAAFASEADILQAIPQFRRRGYTIVDAYIPYPVHGLDEAMGIEPSRLGWACFLFGAPALAAALAFQAWVMAVDWPVNIGGKPFFSWQVFVPVAFEFTVLCAGLGTVAALFAARRLFPGRRSLLPGMGATDDRFVLAVLKSGVAFDLEEALSVCRECRAVETREFMEDAS